MGSSRLLAHLIAKLSIPIDGIFTNLDPKRILSIKIAHTYTPMKEKLVEIILSETKAVCEASKIKIDLSAGANTALYTRDSSIDSLTLVRLISGIEDSIDEELGHSIALADDRAMSMKSSPFRSVDALADYAAEQIANK